MRGKQAIARRSGRSRAAALSALSSDHVSRASNGMSWAKATVPMSPAWATRQLRRARFATRALCAVGRHRADGNAGCNESLEDDRSEVALAAEEQDLQHPQPFMSYPAAPVPANALTSAPEVRPVDPCSLHIPSRAPGVQPEDKVRHLLPQP